MIVPVSRPRANAGLLIRPATINFLHRDADLQGAALRVFLRVVEQCLRAHSSGAGISARLGAVAFIHRFGSTLNPHLHFHCVVIDGVFEPAPAGLVVFRPATGVDANAIAQVQACVRRRLLRTFVRRGLLPGDAAQAMAQWEHGGGFSVDGSVRIEAADLAGRERLLRYCVRPPFALERLRELDGEHLLYASTQPGSGGIGPLVLTPLDLLDRLAALVPPPRIHHHRYFGVLARTAAHGKFPWRPRTAGVGRERPDGDRRSSTRSRHTRRSKAVTQNRSRRRMNLTSAVHGIDPVRQVDH